MVPNPCFPSFILYQVCISAFPIPSPLFCSVVVESVSCKPEQGQTSFPVQSVRVLWSPRTSTSPVGGSSSKSIVSPAVIADNAYKWDVSAFVSRRSSSEPSKPLQAPNSPSSALTLPHPKPASRSLHQLPQSRELHPTQQPQPRSHRPLPFWGAASGHARVNARSGQLVTEQ